jgi:hypothetical protein
MNRTTKLFAPRSRLFPPGASPPRPRSGLFLALAVVTTPLVAMSCGGGAAPKTASNAGSSAAPQDEGTPAPSAEASEATTACGSGDSTKVHDLNGTDATESLTPCAGSGKNDYSGLIRIENVPNGVRIIINAKDDEVTELGPDVRSRDAVLVFPKGPGSTQSVEVPLVKTATGYTGDKIVLYSDLDQITDQGTKIDVAIFDHDKSSGKPAEELHVSVAVSAGMSCAGAEKAFPQHEGASQPDYSQLQAPMHTNAFDSAVGACNPPSSMSLNICALVQGGSAKGVTVKTSPTNNQVAVCLDRVTRGLHFPSFGEPGEVKWVSKGN